MNLPGLALIFLLILFLVWTMFEKRSVVRCPDCKKPAFRVHTHNNERDCWYCSYCGKPISPKPRRTSGTGSRS